MAQLLAGMLNEGVHPVIPRSGSVGAADLCLMAHVGLAMIGEGEAEFSGVRMGSAQALSAAGLLALSPGPKDGLAICSANSVSAGTAALALADARALLDCAQISAALSMEGFRAALTPLDPRVVKARAPARAGVVGGGPARAAGRRLADRARRLPTAAGPAQLPLRQPAARVAARRVGSCWRPRSSPSSTAPPTTRWC